MAKKRNRTPKEVEEDKAKIDEVIEFVSRFDYEKRSG